MQPVFVLFIFASVCLFHILIFWLVYKKVKIDLPIKILFRGVVAGVIAGFFCAVLLSFVLHPWLIIIHFYFMIYEAVAGMFFTGWFWCASRKLELNVSILGRALLGGFIGAVFGMVFGLILWNHEPLHPSDGNIYRTLFMMMSVFTIIASASGIMVGETESE